MRRSVMAVGSIPQKITNLGNCPSNLLIQNIGCQQFAVVGATNGSPNVTYESGKHFNVNWPSGTPITIGGAEYIISSVTSTTALVLTSNFTGATGTVYGMTLLASVYISDDFQSLTGNAVNGAPASGLILGPGGSLSVTNWSADLYALADTDTTAIEVISSTLGAASLLNSSGQSNVSGGASSSGSGSGGGSSGTGYQGGGGGKLTL
jgi:uncharacterized membrane protein YgcG